VFALTVRALKQPHRALSTGPALFLFAVNFTLFLKSQFLEIKEGLLNYTTAEFIVIHNNYAQLYEYLPRRKL